MRKWYIKLRSLHSQNVQIQKEITMKLDEDLHSIIVARNELDHQLKDKIDWIEKSSKDFYKLLINAK